MKPIKFKFFALSGGIKDIDRTPYIGKTVDVVVKELLTSVNVPVDDNSLSLMGVLVNGHLVDRDFWPVVAIKENDDILVHTILKGNGRSVFNFAVAAVAAVIVGVIVGAGNPAAGWQAGALTFSGIYTALNIINPPTEGLPELGWGDQYSNNYSRSQMFTLESQSNAVKKYGFVPKVYGTFKTFPNVAAAPYTDIEADPTDGKLVQYFTAIYDFGFGPATVSELKIGDTNISEYEDVTYRLVDLNKPTVSEGPWDDVTYNSFSLYKGEVEQEAFNLAINKNKDDGAGISEYQIIRNCSPLVNGSKQEIVIDFVNPQGLIGYAADGTHSERNIDLEIYFSKASEDVWRGWNDPTYTDSSKGVGGSSLYDDTWQSTKPLTNTNFPTVVGTGNPVMDGVICDAEGTSCRVTYKTPELRGFPTGTTAITLATSDLVIGDRLYFKDGSFISTISSVTSLGGGYSSYGLTTPTTRPYGVLETTITDIWLDGTPAAPAYTDIPASASAQFFVRRLSTGLARITRDDATPVYSTFKFTPKEIAAYKVKIVRRSTSSAKAFTVKDNLTLTALSSRFDRQPILTDKRHLFIELRIRATNQLNGTLNNLSGVVQSVLDVYDSGTSTWSKQITNNPAWVFCDLLTGEINKRAISKNRLHMASIVEWADFCDEIPTSPQPLAPNVFPRFTSNFIFDFNATLQAILHMVSSAGNASLNLVDGKYGVLIDNRKTVPIQIFTPRNSWNFSSTRAYLDPVHALRIKYSDPASSWQLKETTVYANGYDATTATKIEDMESFAVTNAEQAYRFGRYYLAASILRQETITINVDFEHMVCTRGDYVKVTQDVMRAGGTPARVSAVSGVRIKIDDAISTGPYSYGYTYRAANGTIATSTLTVVDSDEFDVAGPVPAVGDLIIIGVVGSIAIDCIVKTISPNEDMTAQLVLIEKADAIHDYESTGDLPNYTPNLSPSIDPATSSPGEVAFLSVVANTWKVVGRNYNYYIKLDWDVPVTGPAYDAFEIYADNGNGGYDLVAATKLSEYTYDVDPDNLGILHSFKVLAVSANGNKLGLGGVGAVTATPLKKTTPPSNVEILHLNITNETLQLEWERISDEDCDKYIVRYAPTLDAVWERGIPVSTVDRNVSMTFTQGRTGTYFVKAVDFNGNESATAAQANTTIPELFNLNVIDQTNDFPTLPGTLSQVVSDGTSLELQEATTGLPADISYYSEGYYYYGSLLDVGDIYSVRLQSNIEAEGYTPFDLMSNWATLDEVVAMSNALSSAWDVETQVRYTDQLNVMSEWVTLDLINPISEGNQDIWTAWKKFTIGDFTGRIFQFRLKLKSTNPSVTPRVFDGVIKSDMPDRVESFDNLVSGVGTYHVTYSYPFKAVPNIQISMESSASGDYYLITSKTISGFDITFYDKNNTVISRTMDVAVKGFGRQNVVVV